MTHQQQELQKQAIDLMVKAISAQVDEAGEEAGKNLAEQYFTYVKSKDDLAKALSAAFIEGATYVFKQIA